MKTTLEKQKLIERALSISMNLHSAHVHKLENLYILESDENMELSRKLNLIPNTNTYMLTLDLFIKGVLTEDVYITIIKSVGHAILAFGDTQSVNHNKELETSYKNLLTELKKGLPIIALTHRPYSENLS